MLGAISKYINDVSVLRRLLFAVTHLPQDLPNIWGVAVEFATNGKESRDAINAQQAQLFMENMRSLDVAAFSTDRHLLQDLVKFQVPRFKPLGVVLISINNKCLLCASKLQLRKDRPAAVVVYDDNMGTIPGSHFHKYCTNRSCGFTQYYGYYTTGGSAAHVLYNHDWESLPYFVSSRETVFCMQLLRRMNAGILLGQQSFKQCADIYNFLHKYSSCAGTMSQDCSLLTERQQVDRRRVEDAFFQYALLRAASWYSHCFTLSTLPLHNDTLDTLSKFTTVYHGAFMEKYANHRCKKPGCSRALVLDGNMKNHRCVCCATYAGYAEFKGLSGRVRTGCPNTPAFKSPYCSIHKPMIAVPQCIQNPDDDNDAEMLSSESVKVSTEEPAGIIVEKRVTRSSTYYKVAWLGRPNTESTWEPASTLPQDLIEDFEAGIQRDLQQQSFTSGGQTIHTISTSRSVSELAPSGKRPRVEPTIDSSSSGVFAAQVHDSSPPKCNTEKDKASVRHHTAGIVVGTWPCGTVVMVGELFGAESKAQVYGNVHTFLQENSAAMTQLEFLIYDDGCHLKRYATHPERRNKTQTAQQIASLNIVVDKFHFPGHVDPWCQEHCNPYKFESLQKVDTEACEQLFSTLSRYARITQHMKREHFLFFLLYLCDEHNRNL